MHPGKIKVCRTEFLYAQTAANCAHITLTMTGQPIPRRKCVCILGILWQESGRSAEWLQRILHQANQVIHMMTRVSTCHAGQCERELCKITEAAVYSRILYGLPYVALTCTQIKRLKATLWKCHRIEMGVPKYACCHDVECTTLHNTLDVRIEVYRESQHLRLSTSSQGRTMLRMLGHDISPVPPLPIDPPLRITIPRIEVRPIPRIMHTECNAGR